MGKTTSEKNTDYYLNLNYPVTVRELVQEDGGGYVASIPQLGSKTFVAVGDTRAEALDALDDLRQILIPMLLERGAALPDPGEESSDQESYSGSLMLRVPRTLHAQLAAEAKRNGCSINKLATQFLAQGIASQTLEGEIKEALREVIAEEVRKALSNPLLMNLTNPERPKARVKNA